MRNGILGIALSCLGLALSAGCMAPASAPTDTAEPEPTVGESTDAEAVLRIELERGHTVTFYEPVPGGLYLAERMAPGQAFVLSDKESTDALAAFARLRPGAPVPAALQAAYERARNLPADTVVRAPALGGGQPEAALAPETAPGVIKQGLTSSSSAATFVNINNGCAWGPQASFCRVNWANGFTAWGDRPTTSALCIVDHYAGNGVTVQITVGSTISSTFQGPGTIAQYSLGVAGTSTTRRIDITNASGDSFHVGCRWGI